MSLTEGLRSNISEALRAKDSRKVETLRGLLADIHNEEIAKRSRGNASEITDEEIIAVFQKEAKKRRESIEIYSKAGRADLETKEKDELTVIESYLPPALSEAEVETIVKKAISGGESNFGKVMGIAMKEIAGRAESKVVTEIIKRNLGGGE